MPLAFKLKQKFEPYNLITTANTMQLIRPTTDLDVKDALILQVAEATHNLASVLAATNEQFWSFPTDRLLAVLNADVDATLATFAANSTLAGAVNSSLDALSLPQFSRRAPTEQGRDDISFNGIEFTYEAPEPEPDLSSFADLPSLSPSDDATEPEL